MGDRKPGQKKPRRHDATFWRDGAYFEHPYWWPGSEPPRVRAGWKRWAAGLVCVALGWGLSRHRTGTEWLLVLTLGPTAGVLAVLAFRRAQEWQHYRTAVKPLAWALAGVIDQPLRDYRSWLHVPENYETDEDTKIVIDVPGDFTAAERDMDDITRTVTLKLSIEAPDVDRKLNSRHPCLVYTRSHPPPDVVKWEEVAKDIKGAGPAEFVVGLGKKRKLVKVSLSEDSPHFGISMGSGAGKSNLATFWILQALMRGWIVLILDSKFFSYPWAFKDMDAEYDLLSNVRYCRRTEDLHDAMAWLGDEFARRTIRAERYIDANARLHADVGTPILVVCEEMNLAENRLKDYWKAECALDDTLPRRSPAFTGLGAVAFGGRAVKMHLVLIGQQLTAASVGGGAIRENIGVKCLSRYSPQSWKMQVGDRAMAPAPWTPGRVQCVAGGEISETQTPWMAEEAGMDGERIRELALSGAVTVCPPGMPGGGNGSLVPAVIQHAHAASSVPPEQGFVVGQDPGVIAPGRGPGAAITLAEAVAEGLFVSIAAARQAKQRQGWEPVVKDPAKGHRYALKDIYAYKRGSQNDDGQ